MIEELKIGQCAVCGDNMAVCVSRGFHGNSMTICSICGGGTESKILKAQISALEKVLEAARKIKCENRDCHIYSQCECEHIIRLSQAITDHDREWPKGGSKAV